jgi:soluble lytic murein transglycosylase
MTATRLPRLIGLAVVLGCSETDPVLSQLSPVVAQVESEATPVSLVSDDPLVRDAQAALAGGHPWRARRLLDPALGDSARRTPELTLVAAATAATLDEWSRVERLLDGAPWLDSVGSGVGHTLLARAALERRADSLAAEHARRGVDVASGDLARGERLVLLARALDRLDARDSSRMAYERAAELLPTIGDWLRLRAAGVASDSARARLLAAVQSAVARDRAGWTDALARERWGDVAGAARQYASLGARATELRLRSMLAGRDTGERAAIRAELLDLVRLGARSAESRPALEVLDQLGRLTSADELVVARNGREVAPASRIAAAYARVLGAGLGNSADRLEYGRLLSRLGRDREAVNVLVRIGGADSIAASAMYQRGRSLVRLGSIMGARTVLRRMLRDFPADTSTARAMFLLSDLAADEGRDAAARMTYRDLAHRFPTSSVTPTARFRAAMIAYAAGDARAAALELDSLRERYPRSDEVLAAGYWSGRAWARAGDSVRARGAWRAVIAASPRSYYSAASARRLGEAPWTPPLAPDSIVPIPDIESGVSRAQLLDRLGMGMEAEHEYEWLEREAERDPSRVLATGRAYMSRGLAWRAARLASRMLERMSPGDERLYRLAYPVPDMELLAGAAKRAGLEPAIVAAIVRQESGFNPRATSGAGARGLMQIMPEVAQQIARAQRIPEWTTGLLYQPEVSFAFGAGHLQAALGQYSDLPRALAAYNAGGSRVRRWMQRSGTADPEVFTERISFPETRDYVRIVQRNRDLYAVLYEW